MEKRNLRINISAEERIILSDCIDFAIHCLYTDRLIPNSKYEKFQLITKLNVLLAIVNRAEVIENDVL